VSITGFLILLLQTHLGRRVKVDNRSHPCDLLSWQSETAIFTRHMVAKGQACHIVIVCSISYILRELDHEDHRKRKGKNIGK
jgi:hypothetical protein